MRSGPTTAALRSASVALAVCATTVALPMAATYAAGPANGPSGVTLAPAHTTPGDPASRSYFIRSVARDGGYRDSVLVHNLGSNALTLAVSPVRAMTASATGVTYAKDAAGDAQWVRPDVTSVHVAAHQTVSVAFSVHVPIGARPGNHLAGIGFSDPNSVVSTSGQLSVRTFYRNVIAVQTNVAGPATAHFTLPSASLRAGAGTGLATLQLRIVNDGRLLDHGRLTLELSRAGYDKTVARSLNLILAADRIDLPTLWPTNLTPGQYDLTATLRGADFPVATLRATVTLADAALGGPTAPIRPFLTTSSPTKHSGSSPVALISVLAAAMLIGVTTAGWLVAARRRRREQHGAPSSTTAPDKELVGV